MRVAYLTGIREVDIQEGPEPTIQSPDDVLLDIDTVGVCGSDMHYYRTGRIGDQVVKFPYPVGHECCATVAEVGSDVTRVKPGQRVAIDPLRWCMDCDQCLAGRFHTCRNQAFLGCPGQADGCLADRIVMPARSCFPIPDEMTNNQAVLLEPYAIGLYAQRLAGAMEGKSVAIFGAGPIGLCVLAACRAAGARATYITEIRPDRIAKARQFGPEEVIDASAGGVVEAITAREPEGVDVAFECAGEQECLDEGVMARRPGGKLMMVGIPETDRISFEIAWVRRKEITLQPVRRQNECVDDAIEMVAKGEVDLDPMVTHEFGLEKTKEAFDMVADYQDGAVKVMIHVSDAARAKAGL